MDFSNCKLSGHYYSGTEKKIGIRFKNSSYMLKFQKYTDFGPCFNHVSEYLGSHIFEMLGFEAQVTYLGTYHGELVVACKDFVGPNEHFVPFNDFGESSLEQDKDSYRYTYEDITRMLEDNKKLTNVSETIDVFWRMFIVDAWLGNFDRHGGNWGFLKKDNAYRLAPIFDNGSCLFSKLSDEEEMKAIISSKEETERRVYGFPTSQIKLNGKKSSYYEVIHNGNFRECNEALKYIVPKINMDEIEALVTKTDVSDIHKEFYIHMLKSRYDLILKENLK